MDFDLSTNCYIKCDDDIKNKLLEINNILLNQQLMGHKVAIYYENINFKKIISFNRDICFYAASTIKILVCLYLIEENKRLKDEIYISKKDFKPGTGIISKLQEARKYTVLELIRLSIVESDNTAYCKLMKLVGKKTIKEYGLSLGATHTMEGKEDDFFGIINCNDMIIYWKRIKKYIDSQREYSEILKEWLSNPSVNLLSRSSINNSTYVKKYGAYDIAYHEAGYVLEKNPYYLIILTQLNKTEYKKELINNIAKKITELHQILNERS